MVCASPISAHRIGVIRSGRSVESRIIPSLIVSFGVGDVMNMVLDSQDVRVLLERGAFQADGLTVAFPGLRVDKPCANEVRTATQALMNGAVGHVIPEHDDVKTVVADVFHGLSFW